MSFRPTARLGDRTHGVCYAHDSPLTVGGTIITASPNVFTNNRGTARIGDIVLADCGHQSSIITGSPTVLANNRLVARIGDKTDGSPYDAEIITASPDTFKEP